MNRDPDKRHVKAGNVLLLNELTIVKESSETEFS